MQRLVSVKQKKNELVGYFTVYRSKAMLDKYVLKWSLPRQTVLTIRINRRPIITRVRRPIRTTNRDLYITSAENLIIHLTLLITSTKLSKRQSMSPQTVLHRTTLTRTIILYRLMI